MTIQSSLAGAAFSVLAGLAIAMPAAIGAEGEAARPGSLILAQASGSAGTGTTAASEDAEAARIKSEEESFMKLLAEQRRQEAEEKARAEAAKKAAAEKAEAERIAKEEETFMKLLAEQRAQEAEEKARAEAAKKAAAEKAEAERIAKEEETFMKLLAEQRRQEAEEKARAEAAKKAAAEAKRREAAALCEKRLADVGRTGTIQFASGSANITAASKALLDQLADAAAACEKELSIQVDGHTDATGPDDLNQRLSVERAKSVATYLVGKGIPAERVTSRGFGESQPIADNATPQGRAKNRRIEFKVN